jgi:hypothetical protein
VSCEVVAPNVCFPDARGQALDGSKGRDVFGQSRNKRPERHCLKAATEGNRDRHNKPLVLAAL